DARTAGSTTFINLNPGVTYTLGAVAKGDTSSYTPSPQYRVSVGTNAPPGQLNDRDIMLSIQSSRNIVVSWLGITDATSYTVNLYLGNDTANPISGPITTTGTTHTFENLEFDTEYTVGVIAQSQDFPNSREARQKIMTERFILSTPMGINLSATINTVTVRWTTVDSTLNIESYLLSISPDTAGVGEQTIFVSANEHTFTGLSEGIAYAVSVVSSRDETGYVASSAYRATIRALPQLDTPVINQVVVDGGTLILTWFGVQNVDNYKANLYLGDGTSGEALQSVSVQNNNGFLVHSFLNLEPLTQYTVELIAQADNFRDSNPAPRTFTTGKIFISEPPRVALRLTLVITESTDNITVNFRNTQLGVDGYTLSIRKNFGDGEIAQSAQDFLISDSPVTFTDLVPDRAYTLMALPIFDSERYEYLGGTLSLDFMTAALPPSLSNPTEVTAVIEARRQSADTVSDIRVAWGSVANAQRYTVTLYAGVDNVSDISALSTKTVSAPATTAVFEDQLNNQFFTVGVTAESDINPNSEEVRTSVLPPKLLRQFFTVTPSTVSLSLAWDSSSDAVLQDGVNFYDATRIDNLGDSASSILRISIED
ncbi:MAG: fibronectin type III domain-containing protein, partial [Candidatus Oxydemutatoraceae bacterium WSBS_2016_MAG_OTU14]